jgi:thiamine-monophosphate kinase
MPSTPGPPAADGPAATGAPAAIGAPGPTLRDLGEDRLVGAVVARFPGAPAWLRVPPGDDAAVLDLPAGAGPVPGAGPAAGAGLVAGTDTVVEGEDFRRDWSTGADVGVKVAAQNLADLAAMGARPLALLVSLAAPADLPAGWATDLADGLAQECTRAGAHVIGGDVSGAPVVVVTGTALGVLDGPAVLRSGARPGDVVALAGVTGPSAAGLALLLAGWAETDPAPDADPAHVPAPDSDPAGASGDQAVAATGDPDPAAVIRRLEPETRRAAAELVEAHRRPRPPYEAGPRAAAAGATALIDTSDGLLRDADRVGRASGVLLDLAPDLLPLPDGLAGVARSLGVDPLVWALTGGEDHALLACFPPDATMPEEFRVIGAVREATADAGPGVLVAGRPWTGESGWLHFR